MHKEDLIRYYEKFKFGEDIFHQLMSRKIREILLVSSFYDAFIFEQDGRFSEQLFGEYHQLNLTSVPHITSVPTGEEALQLALERDFDMVITMLHVGEVTPFEMARQIKAEKPELPIFLLLNVQADAARIDKSAPEMAAIDNVFLWSGDSKVFLAMIKFVEDMLNVEHDTEMGLVRVILLVEDSIFFYSRFLPQLCTEVMSQVQLLLSDELNDVQKNYRMRTRPKILMAHDYESAVEICEKYRDYLLCVISDIRFPKGGELDENAGLELVRYIQDAKFDMPILLQSAGGDFAETAHNMDVHYIDKNSPTLIKELSDFIHFNLGFGDFIFRDESGREFGRAANLAEFEALLRVIPRESLFFHSRRNDFSTWLIAHGEILVAREIRPMRIADFEDSEELREFLISIFNNVRKKRHKGKVVDFNTTDLDLRREVTRLSEGSLGGKGRGIAFLNALITATEIENRFQNLDVVIPRSAFIGTAEYDDFVLRNGLFEKMIDKNRSDNRIKADFLAGEVSEELHDRLEIMLEHIPEPIAVRSSGLLEDSQAQPFAGIYQTFMLPNNDPDPAVRLDQLLCAIKLVFASTCLEDARAYADLMNYGVEEEKMAVIIQEVAGKRHGDYFYPHISGTAQSYDYYPPAFSKHDNGIATIALGLGEWVVGGKSAFRFSPKQPHKDILPPVELIGNSQKEFYALDMRISEFDLSKGTDATYALLDLAIAEKHGVINHLASVWDIEDNSLREGIGYKGPRVLTFADIIKYDFIPLADLLDEILDIGEHAFGVPIEIEFAVTLGDSPEERSTFHLLQIRPLAISEGSQLELEEKIDLSELWLYSGEAMGNGVLENIRDIVYVDPNKFDKLRTLEMLDEIKAMNLKMRKEDCEYILIGPGRWGTRDRFLGIPVRWADIDRAKVIVEAGLEEFKIDSSQGTHFFHNIVATQAGYFHVPFDDDTSFIDWDFLEGIAPTHRGNFLVHIRREQPFGVKMFGRSGVAIIRK